MKFTIEKSFILFLEYFQSTLKIGNTRFRPGGRTCFHLTFYITFKSYTAYYRFLFVSLHPQTVNMETYCCSPIQLPHI